MLGYQKGVKGYRSWSMELNNNKVIISRDVTFRELEMPYKAKNDQMIASKEKSSIQVELLDDLKITKEMVDTQIPEEVEESQNEATADDIDNGEDLSDYLLARDRQRRENVKRPARYSNASLVHYAFCVAEEVESSEPST